MSNDDVVFVYVTYPDMAAAKASSHIIVSEKLAACANLIPGMTSIYEWEGKTKEADEVSAIYKTRKTLVERLMGRLRAEHPYDVPAILEIPIERLEPTYMKWLFAQTQQAAA